jgi:CubicO group peptidase (beta-lactamase class C family)
MCSLVTPLLLLTSLAPAAVPHVAEVDAYVGQQMSDLHIPGLSLAIYYKGAVYKNAWGWANVELDAPACTNTVYELASMSKPFLATAAVLLTREHNPPFKLDDKIRKHLPEVPATWAGIKVSHLLTHTSGIVEYLKIPGFSTRVEYSDADLLNMAARYPPCFTPGDRFCYTNTGYCVLAMLMERTTKKHYDQILRERIFEPLHMHFTRVNDSSEIIPRRAAGHSFGCGRRLHADFVAQSQLAFADCGVISTVNDLLLWDKELWKKDSKILPKDLLNQMWARPKLNNGTLSRYGLGWDLYPVDQSLVTEVAHGGAIEGFRSIIYRYLRDELSVIVLFNCDLDDWKNYDFARDVADRVVGNQPSPRPHRASVDEKRRSSLRRH